MKKVSALLLAAILLSLCSCDVIDMLGGASGSGISYYRHTITSSDETADSSTGTFVITVTNAKFTGTYWAELWVINDSGYLVPAVPQKPNSVWLMRPANFEGYIRFRNGSSMVGTVVYIYYSPASAL